MDVYLGLEIVHVQVRLCAEGRGIKSERVFSRMQSTTAATASVSSGGRAPAYVAGLPPQLASEEHMPL